jgi:arylsulfatase A-like enzyme
VGQQVYPSDMKKNKLPIVIIVIIIIVAWLGVKYNSAPSSSINTIILISLDTTRADHIGTYGYRVPTTPNIDALAKESMVFEQTFSNIPLTLPAHSSMFTGQIPPTHGVHDNLATALPETATTLPEVLQANGYATYGIVSAIVMDHQYGLNQGFDTYDDVFEAADKGTLAHVVERSGDETTAHAIRWLKDHANEKKFMFLHYYDPHFAYEPPPPFDKQFKHPYDGEIAFTDHCIGQFIDQLKAQKEYENALIVVTADHGEMLGEHGEETHTYYIYQSAIKVPLVIKYPRSSAVKRVTEPCGLIDIPPTILSLAGIKVPETMTGVDLSQYRNDAYTLPERGLYSESLTATKYNGNSLLGIIKGPWHYIQTTRSELYDRLKDPKEEVNLIKTEPHRARMLQSDLAGILETAVNNDQDTAIQIDQKTVNMLESLGYVGGAIDTDFSFNTEKPDPKDLIDIHNVFMFSAGSLR